MFKKFHNHAISITDFRIYFQPFENAFRFLIIILNLNRLDVYYFNLVKQSTTNNVDIERVIEEFEISVPFNRRQ